MRRIHRSKVGQPACSCKAFASHSGGGLSVVAVFDQVRDDTYDFEANKTLIKLYLLFPSEAKEELCALVRRAYLYDIDAG